MSKNPSATRRVSVKKDGITKSAKQNVDTIYLIQNENQILKLKNTQIADKIAELKAELIQCTSQLAKDEQECERLRNQIKRSQMTDDIRLQAEKKMVEEKIQLMKGNCDLLVRKIAEARQAAVFQQHKIPNIRQEKKILQRSLWENKTQNQGTKIVLQNLQRQLEKYRSQNAELVSKRKQYGPKQSQISTLIQQRLRIIKSRQKQSKIISKQQAAELLYYLVNKLQFNRKKNNFVHIQKFGYVDKIMKKRVFLLSLIRRKYLLFVKNQIMQKFRESFRPLKQLEAFQTIVQRTQMRRTKNRMFRIWRKQANKREYLKIRYFQTQTVLQKIAESYQKSVIFSTFNQLKYLKLNPIHRGAAITIQRIARSAQIRCKSMFFSRLNSLGNQYLKDLQIQQSAKEQSTLLVLSVYFTNWSKVAKDNKASNRYIKFKYFKQLKKLVHLKRKRQLSQMLTLTVQKIKQIDSTSTSFCHMKKQTTLGIIEALDEQKQQMSVKNKEMQTKLNNAKAEHKQTMQTFGLLKLSSYLKKKVQTAFNSWRKFNSQIHKLQLILNMLHGKMMNDVNLGFVMIQRRRFEKLKKSISDKIQSCQFSYNYLVKQNAHIKQVLDNKLLQLQKSKFSNILRRLIRREKQTKHKYFYKFLKNGYKYWKFRRLVVRVDNMVEQKIKRVFMFLIKQINTQKKEEQTLENRICSMIQKRQNKSVVLAFGILQNVRIKNKKLKRILENVFSRNLQLAVYNSYNSIKKILTTARQAHISSINTKVQEKIKQADRYTGKTEQNIEILRERLRNKQKSIKSRIMLTCRKIFIKNNSNKYLAYFNRWRSKLAYEKRIQKFVQIMERKTRILLKNRLMSNLIKKNSDQQVGQLKSRLQNFTNQLNEASTIYEKFAVQSENKMKRMEQQNKFHDQEAKILVKRTDRMDDVKVASFRLYWGKMMCKFAFRQWRIHLKQFVDQWTRVFHMLESISRRQTFLAISSQMRNQIIKNRIRKNLSYIYAKKFRNNAGNAFKIWRIVNLNAKNKESEAAFQLEVSNYKIVADKYQKVVHAYQSSVNSRVGDRKLRKIFDFLKKYTRLKIDNNNRKLKLQQWLKRGYQIQFYRLFTSRVMDAVQKNRRLNKFMAQKPLKKTRKVFQKIAQIVRKKKCIKRLFLGKFIHYSLLKLYQDFFSQTKYYYRYVQVTKKNYQTMCIQKLMQTFDKKRKDILCKNMRRWRKNQYEVNIGKKLFKRLTRKAIYNRYQGMFYAWKLESEAKGVVKYHNQEGQIKKRKVEIKRIQKFLHQFKKDKGLLLENEEGNFVMSPRFQKKKQQQQKRDKNLRYKFISRLIMSINGYAAPIKAYNNLQMYMKLRQKYRKTATFVLNHLRRPDVLLAFRTWNKAAVSFKQDFQNMERKQLIKILNKQKDKMQMQYSNKLSVDQKIDIQLNRYKVFSHQRDKKQKLCAYVFMRNAKKVKGHAFQTWRKRVNTLRDEESKQLARRGQSRLEDLEEQIRQMKQIQEELSENSRRLRQAVNQALQIAQMVKRISQQRDKLSHIIMQKNLTCQSLIEENQVLNSKLHLAQKQAIRLMVISGERP